MSVVYCLNVKEEPEEALVSYHTLVEKERNIRMYRIRLDKDAENTSTEVATFSKEYDIIFEYCPTHSKE